MAKTNDWTAKAVFVHGRKKNVEWWHIQHPRVRVRHCGHATASWPYFIAGIEQLVTFRTLAEAKAYVESGEYAAAD